MDSSIPPVVCLSSAEVEKLLSMDTTIGLMREAFSIISEESAEVPVRMNLPIDPPQSCSLVMPAHIPKLKAFGLKTANVFHGNKNIQLPAIHATYLIFNGETGQLRGMMDAEYLTMLRTGAGAGLATDLLAHPKSKTLAVFGTGIQAQGQIEAVCAVRPIEAIHIFCQNQQKGQLFCEKMQDRMGRPVELAPDPQTLSQADIVCTATSSTKPVFEAGLLKPGVHLNGVGSFTRLMAEIPQETVGQARLFVDQRKAALQEAGDITQALDGGFIDETKEILELGELVNGQCIGRTCSEEITFFKSVGNAVQDLVCAEHLVQLAIEQKVGTTITM